MEKKKLLLVTVSVGVFLVIVVSAAILIIRTGSELPAVSSAMPELSNRSATTDPSILSRDEFRELQDPDSVSPIQENQINLNGSTETSTGSTAASTVISVPKPSTPAVPDAPARPAVQVQAAPAAVKPAVAAAPAPAAPKKNYRDFWVQAGSFSTRERADGVKNTLYNKGISAIITNQEIEGNTYYRVRVGPYTSQNEADYWLAMIKSIDGFQDSQIWETQTYR